MKIINKALVLLAIVSLVFAFNPGRTYASNPVQDSPICTITADNLNPTPSSSVTENFTVSFNSGITSSDQTWYLYLNAHLGDGSSGGSVNPSNVVVNSNDFPSSLAKYGDGNALISSTTVSEDAVAGNTYHISTTWDAHNVQVGTVWLPQFSNDSNNGCYTGNTNTSIT